MLRHRAGKEDGSACSVVSGSRASVNMVLREALQGQQHALAGLRSMLAADPVWLIFFVWGETKGL